jgi:uncharacterized protein (DUF58 family)
VRDFLASPTPRGRILFAAAAVLGLLSLLLGQRDVMHVAVICAVMPLLSMLLVVKSQGSMALTRTVRPNRVQIGQQANVRVRVRNESGLPSGTMLLQENMDPSLGGPRRIAVQRISPQGRRDVDYVVTARSRGVHSVGPMSVTTVDPFGLASLTRTLTECEHLIAIPTVETLASRRFGGLQSGSGDQRSGALSTGGEDDVVPRLYRTGDELRRIHWRASARAGELMVRHEEQPWKLSATLIVDLRVNAHNTVADGLPTSENSSLEWTVSAAASVSDHLIQRGFSVTLTDTRGVRIGTAADAHARHDLLTTLATLHPTAPHRVTFSPDTQDEGGNAIIVAVIGPMESEDAEAIAAMRRNRSGVAIIVEPSTWGATGTAQISRAHELRTLLTSRGWATAIAQGGSTVAAVWNLIDALPATSAVGDRSTDGATP